MRAYKGRRDVSDDIAFYEETIKPAQAGDSQAMLATGMHYKNRGNYDTARYWFAKSAESGHLPAFCILADITDTLAIKWFYYAAELKKVTVVRIYSWLSCSSERAA